jgi:hypothetical protein
MTPPQDGLTTTDLMAAASKVLSDGNYRQVTGGVEGWDTATSRLFEDEYNVVGIAVFETCAELLESWPDVQGSLVNVISQHIGREESKAWDGYLVLLSPDLASAESQAIEAVRYNTTRLRKMVSTGEDLRVATDVERVLRALLPLGGERTSMGDQSALDLLPKLLADHGIGEDTTSLLVDAFREQAPLMERLHQQGEKR